MLGLLKSIYDRYVGLSLTLKIGVVAFLFGFLVGGCTCREWRKNVIEELPPTEAHSFGWVDKPDYVRDVVATFASPFFSDAGRHLIRGADGEKDVFLWKAYEKVTGHPWRAHDQNGTGCCVGEGFSTGVEIGQAVDIALSGKPFEYKDISASAVYALSREIGHFLGNQDGSTGADAAKALQQLGAVSSEEAGDDNTTGRQHGQVAKKWGRTGLPSALKEIAARHKVKTVSLVRTPEEVRAALTNGYPVPICSGVGFEPFRRDSDGFCRPGGTWPHCMCIVGYRADKRAFLVLQSWGESVPPGPKSLGQPDCSFWITWDACQRIVRAGESYALSSYDGYPARQIDFFVQRKETDRWYASSLRLQLPRFALAP